jgi:hypothetical protein
MVQRTQHQRAFQAAPTTFYFCQSFILFDNLLRWHSHVGAFQKHNAVYLLFPLERLDSMQNANDFLCNFVAAQGINDYEIQVFIQKAFKIGVEATRRSGGSWALRR